MNDPRRLLDEESDCPAEERELLEAGRQMQPPPGMQESSWAALQTRLNSGGNGSDGGSSGGSISSTVGGFKGALVGLAGSVAIGGIIAAFMATSNPSPPANPSPIESTTVLQVVEPAAVEPQKNTAMDDTPKEFVAPAPTLPEPPSNVEPVVAERSARPKTALPIASASASSSPAKESASRLREENRLLIDARAALRDGDPSAALGKLDSANEQFPDGILAQEREVLAIEALARSGRKTDAANRARSFLVKYPTSPHATKVRSFVRPEN